jgi:hypothetical protein
MILARSRAERPQDPPSGEGALPGAAGLAAGSVPTRTAARSAMADYIAVLSNRQPRHSHLR